MASWYPMYQSSSLAINYLIVAGGGAGGGNGGGGGGASKLADLDDVAISGILDLDILQYDADALIWRNSVGILDGGTFN